MPDEVGADAERKAGGPDDRLRDLLDGARRRRGIRQLQRQRDRLPVARANAFEFGEGEFLRQVHRNERETPPEGKADLCSDGRGVARAQPAARRGDELDLGVLR